MIQIEAWREERAEAWKDAEIISFLVGMRQEHSSHEH